MTAELAAFPKVTGFLPVHYAICLKGIIWREGLRFLHQRERFVASLVRPPCRAPGTVGSGIDA